MLVKKKPYEFWQFRDTRKQGFPKVKVPELPVVQTAVPKTVKGLISHHILLPISELPQPLLDRLRADLTLVNPEFVAAKKYGKGFVSYSIPEYLRFYAIDSQYLGLPRSVKMNYVHARFKDVGLKLELEDVRPQFETITFPEKGEITPLFYQKEAINQILHGNVVIKLRCGRGKTFLTLMAIANIRLRALILVRTNILINQWVEAITKIFDIQPDQVGIINGKTKREGLITVATEQSLIDLPREEKRRLGETYGHLVLDECHEVPAGRFRELMTYFKSRYVTGLSGTPFREDGLEPVIKLYIGPIVEIDDLGEFTTKVMLRKTKFNYHFVSKVNHYHDLVNSLIHNTDRNHLIINDLVSMVWQGKTVVCYSSRIEHMHILRDMFKQVMPEVPVDILASERDGQAMTPEQQEEIRNKLRNQDIKVCFGGHIIEQGFDCPPLSTVILATPTKSRRLIEQVVGRCQREYPGKKEAILVDYVDEKTKILLFQFFHKNQRVYKKYIRTWLS